MDRDVLQGEVLPFNRLADRNRRVVILNPADRLNTANPERMELLAYRGCILIFIALLIYLLFQLDSDYRKTVHRSLELLRAFPPEPAVVLPSITQSDLKLPGDKAVKPIGIVAERIMSEIQPKTQVIPLNDDPPEPDPPILIRKTQGNTRSKALADTSVDSSSAGKPNTNEDPSRRRLLEKAQLLARSAQWRDASTLFKQACSVSPGDSRCQLNLAVCLDRLGESDSAYRAYLTALDAGTPALPETARIQVVERVQELRTALELH